MRFLLNKIKEIVIGLFNNKPLLSGIITFLIAFVLLVYIIKKEGHANFFGRSIASWNAYVSLWALVVVLFILSGFLLFGNIQFF